MRILRQIIFPVFLNAGIFLLSPAIASDIEGASLTIGQGWAVVRESRTVDLVEGRQTLVLDGIPTDADVSSLILSVRSIPVQLLEWERTDVQDQPRGQLQRTANAVQWKPERHKAPTSDKISAGNISVRCLVEARGSGKSIPLELSYRVTGFKWSTHYQVAIRGEFEDEKEPVSVDLDGLVRISNPCSVAFRDVTIRFVGVPLENPNPSKPPGLLMLDSDSALADLWRNPIPGPQTEYEYILPRPTTLKASTLTDIFIVRTARTPATHIYSMVSEEFPVGVADRDRALENWIVFKNTAANRLGFPLPPGPVDVYLGAMRNRLLQSAWFARTPVEGELRIDLGRAEDVRGVRVSRGQTAPVGGYFEQTFAIILRNRKTTDVRVEVDEKPSINLPWNMISATKAFVEVPPQRLRFSPVIKANGEEVIEYKLSIHQPQM